MCRFETWEKYLVAEPASHVSLVAFDQRLETAVRAGFAIELRLRIPISRVSLLAT